MPVIPRYGTPAACTQQHADKSYAGSICRQSARFAEHCPESLELDLESELFRFRVCGLGLMPRNLHSLGLGISEFASCQQTQIFEWCWPDISLHLT